MGERTAHAGIIVAWGQSWAMATALKRVRAMVVNFILGVVQVVVWFVDWKC